MLMWVIFTILMYGTISEIPPGYLVPSTQESGWASPTGLKDDICRIKRARACSFDKDTEDCMSKKTFLKNFYTKQPLLISGFMDSWIARESFQKDAFLNNHGSVPVDVGTSAEILFFEGTAHSDKIPLREFTERMLSGEDIFVFEPEHDFYLDDFIIPSWLTQMTPEPGRHKENVQTQWGESIAKWTILSFGGNEAGLGWHMHGNSWLGLVSGRKRWFLYEPGKALPKQRSVPLLSSARWVSFILPQLSSAERPQECVQLPGEIMYLPAAWAHLTMNEGVALGIGAQVS
jgi:ribosomal protein L16 Arg81 hydroxylase